jgi:hypothetical protein
LEKIACFDNLYEAFYKAKKGKEGKPEVRIFQNRLSENLNGMRRELLNGNIVVGNYHYFTIFDPKERTICAAGFPERVLHHALMNQCHPAFERYQVYDSYATRENKGTFSALERAATFQKQFRWYCKFDVRKYFDSIDHVILTNQLCSLFKDKQLLELLRRIIESYQVKEGKGVPIGNLTSQYFANHYLAGMDHYIKEVLRVPAYVRYMDDFIIWHDDKERILELKEKISAFLSQELELNLKTMAMNRASSGLPFVGFYIFPDKIFLTSRSRKRFIDKMNRYDRLLKNGTWSQSAFQRHALSLNAFVFHADTLSFRKMVLKKMGNDQG